MQRKAKKFQFRESYSWTLLSVRNWCLWMSSSSLNLEGPANPVSQCLGHQWQLWPLFLQCFPHLGGFSANWAHWISGGALDLGKSVWLADGKRNAKRNRHPLEFTTVVTLISPVASFSITSGYSRESGVEMVGKHFFIITTDFISTILSFTVFIF